MQKFKLRIKRGIEDRGFQLIQIFEKDSGIPWWIEERWIIQRSFDQLQLNVLFETDGLWESGSKIVSDVYICHELPTNHFYQIENLACLSLAKGNFDLKLSTFFQQFDEYLTHSVRP